MGGQNHQPCNQPGTAYLKYSTHMSRSLSFARSELERANIALENVLLSEIVSGEGTRLSVRSVVEHLGGSMSELRNFDRNVEQLRGEMENHNFEDLPTLATADLDAIGAEFVANGLVTQQAWQEVVGIMREQGFYGMLEHFGIMADVLNNLTADLTLAIVSLPEKVQLTALLERNGDGNFKKQFAELYQAWNTFQQVFLASSMLSTELWYIHQGVGSVLDEHTADESAA